LLRGLEERVRDRRAPGRDRFGAAALRLRREPARLGAAGARRVRGQIVDLLRPRLRRLLLLSLLRCLLL
ncbi:hypothetical protein KDA82_39750, partial [Streptomyces daliensis]|nr:hypothetical protein [Streptomyces daliensis]